MRNKKRLICELSVFALSSWFGILRSASMYENSDFRVRIVDQLLTGADTFLLYHNTVFFNLLRSRYSRQIHRRRNKRDVENWNVSVVRLWCFLLTSSQSSKTPRISFVLQRSVHALYFFVTDCFATNEVTMKYCPTESMITDFFTKTLQGATFQKFRDQIMNADLDAPGLLDHSSAL